MLIKQVMEVFDVLDSSTVNGAAVKDYLLSVNPEANVEVYPLEGPKGSTDMVKVRILQGFTEDLVGELVDV